VIVEQPPAALALGSHEQPPGLRGDHVAPCRRREWFQAANLGRELEGALVLLGPPQEMGAGKHCPGDDLESIHVDLGGNPPASGRRPGAPATVRRLHDHRLQGHVDRRGQALQTRLHLPQAALALRLCHLGSGEPETVPGLAPSVANDLLPVASCRLETRPGRRRATLQQLRRAEPRPDSPRLACSLDRILLRAERLQRLLVGLDRLRTVACQHLQVTDARQDARPDEGIDVLAQGEIGVRCVTDLCQRCAPTDVGDRGEEVLGDQETEQLLGVLQRLLGAPLLRREQGGAKEQSSQEHRDDHRRSPQRPPVLAWNPEPAGLGDGLGQPVMSDLEEDALSSPFTEEHSFLGEPGQGRGADPEVPLDLRGLQHQPVSRPIEKALLTQPGCSPPLSPGQLGEHTAVEVPQHMLVAKL
jgi:hypothetical protein